MDRRDFFKGMAGLGATAFLATSCSSLLLDEQQVTTNKTTSKSNCGNSPSNASSGSFSFVHVTDQHVQARRKGEAGYLKCVQTINALNPKPAFVMMGGDMVFDGCYSPKERYLDNIRIYKEVSNELEMPYFHCMGNHDPLGLHPRRKVQVNDPDFGKKCIMDKLDWPSPYYSFDFQGWHFIVLDSIKVVDIPDKGPTYIPAIDDEQLEWLRGDLGNSGGKPSVAFMHIGAFSNIAQINQNMESKAMDGGMIINNTKDLRLILERHNVKALVQGHSHQIDEFMFNNIWYITSASGSGCWWSGNWNGYDPGYTVFKCDAGKLAWEHVTYQWEPQLEPEDDLERKKTAEYAELLKNKEAAKNEDAAKGKSLIIKPTPKLHVKL